MTRRRRGLGTRTTKAGLSSTFGPPRLLVLPALTPRVSEVGTWTDEPFTNQLPFASRINNGAGAVGDQLTWHVFLAAGTYTVALSHRCDTNRGIATLALNGTTLQTFDMYEASPANRRAKWTGKTVATTGLQVLTLTMATKNASSSGYAAVLGGIEMTRTGA